MRFVRSPANQNFLCFDQKILYILECCDDKKLQIRVAVRHLPTNNIIYLYFDRMTTLERIQIWVPQIERKVWETSNDVDHSTMLLSAK